MGVPPQLWIHEEFIEPERGLKLLVRSWRPQRNVRGALAIVHGFNSHSAYYAKFAEHMATHGIAVYAIDLRGRGRSAGERFYVERFDDYVSDVHALVSLVQAREPKQPVILLGHSAGGVIACVCALERQDALAGFICESFAFEVPAPTVVLRVIAALSSLVPTLPVLRLDNAQFSRDPAVIARMNDDPLIAHERQPVRTVAEMFRANTRLSTQFGRLALPLLILHGSADTVTRPSGSERLYREAGSSDKTLRVLAEYYHDLLNDCGSEVVIDEVLAWIDARLQAPAPNLTDDGLSKM